MGLKSTENRSGAVIVVIHWSTVIPVLTLIAIGFSAANTVNSVAKAATLRFHVPIVIMIMVLLLTAFRIIWWWLLDRRPKPVAGSPLWRERLSQIVHYSLYVVILATIASGMGLLALSGAAPAIFGGGETALPDFWKYPPRLVRGIGARLLILLVALHFGAALHHLAKAFTRAGMAVALLARRTGFSPADWRANCPMHVPMALNITPNA